MPHLLLSIMALNLLAAMAPGPDFAVVTKNTLQYSRRIGMATALGISTAVLIHITYCALGLALLITHTPWLFNGIKLIGGIYLIYLGAQALKPHPSEAQTSLETTNNTINSWQAFRQGFLTNLLNPKCMLFFFALFSLVIGQQHFGSFLLLLMTCLFLTVFTWFCLLSWLLSHPKLEKGLARLQPWILRLMGIFLGLFGVALFFVK